MTFRMPSVVAEFVQAHRRLCEHYAETNLKFTLDGKLVGDLGEAIAAELFDLTLCKRRIPGVDAHTKDGRSVQVKATGLSSKGPAFSAGEGTADHLIFLQLDFANAKGEVAYNGPEAPVRKLLPSKLTSTKRVTLNRIRQLEANMPANKRLVRKDRR